MNKAILVTSALLLIFSCKQNNKEEDKLDAVNETKNETNVVNQNSEKGNSDFIVIKISDRPEERIEKNEEFGSPTDLNTTRLNGNVVTTFSGALGTFDYEKDYGFHLVYTRKSEDNELKIGTYPLVAFNDGVKLQPKTDGFFEAINTQNSEFYENVKKLGNLESYIDEFYTPFSKDNVLVIESAGNLVETPNSSGAISEHFQEVKGYFLYHIIEIATSKKYSVRVDFSSINEIRIINKK